MAAEGGVRTGVHGSSPEAILEGAMRNVMTWQSLAVGTIMALGCASQSLAQSRSSTTDSTAVVDSARALVTRLEQAMNRRDVAGVMANYPDTAVVSAVSGELFTSRNAMEAELDVMLRKLDYVYFEFGDPIVTPVGPSAAAVTVRYSVQTESHGLRRVRQCGVWSGVVAQRRDRYLILHEHQSVRLVVC